MNDADLREQIMHTARLCKAIREKFPFSIWRQGKLIGETYNWKELISVY